MKCLGKFNYYFLPFQSRVGCQEKKRKTSLILTDTKQQMFHDNQAVDMYQKEWAVSFQCSYEIEV